MKLFDIINRYYESSSSGTEQYRTAKRQFKSLMKKIFNDCQIIIDSCPHFEFSGFVKKEDKYVYFSFGDLRWKSNMLVRAAKHDKDWTGGSNNFVNYNEGFDENFRDKVKQLLS